MVPLDVEHARQRLGETNYDETGALDDGHGTLLHCAAEGRVLADVVVRAARGEEGRSGGGCSPHAPQTEAGREASHVLIFSQSILYSSTVLYLVLYR